MDTTQMMVEDDLSTMSRKALEKLAKREFGMSDDEINAFKRLTTDELRDHIRQLRAQANPQPQQTEEANESQPWKLTINVIPLHQLGRDCFLGTIKYRDLNKIEVDADVQRPESKKRIPEIAKYVAGNDGFFSAAILTVSGAADGRVMLDEENGQCRLIVSSDARIVVNDGQHRIAGIKRAIAERLDPERLDDDLPVLIYTDLTREEQRQLFADINLNATKPPKAIALNYDDRNLRVKFAKELVEKCVAFRGKVNFVKVRVGEKDTETFTFSTIVDAIENMWGTQVDDKWQKDPLTPDNYASRLPEAIEFWRRVDEVMGAHWDAKNFATNKNAIIAIARLNGFDIDWAALGNLDWSDGGEMSRVASEAGGTNAAVAALYREIAKVVVKDGGEG